MTHVPAPHKPTRSRILIVDDNELMRVFYERLFKRHADELDVELKATAESGLDFLKRNLVDAVILDWDLPVKKGLDVLKALRADPRTEHLPVIMVSGRCATADRALAEKHGVSAYFEKPFETAVLLDRLRALLRSGHQAAKRAKAASVSRQALIVDDEPAMRALYQSLFGRRLPEFDYRFCESVEEAAPVLSRERVDLLVMDWDLPGVSGLELLKALRAHPRGRGVRVMIITGRGALADRTKAIACGADDFMQKPFDVEDFVGRVRELFC